jgi:DNA-binding winged helix-turn-helix (wHTH) protein
MTVHSATVASPSDSLTFLDFRLDRRSGRLLHGRESIPLRPKTWAVLLYLADRPGVLVTRDELLDAVWPHVAVTPDTLSKSIGELREALGDDARKPRFLETVHRRGFRFIASIEQPQSSDASWRPGPTGGLVGRDDELRRLRGLLGEACAGRRRIALVTAGAGVGKTALVDAFLTAAEREVSPLRIGRGGCFEQHAVREPYMPVLDALERLVHAGDRDADLGALRQVAPTWLAQLPGLAAGEKEAPRQSRAPARPERMLREFAALTEELAAGAPLLLVLEDLHWSDPSTVDLLSFLGVRREPARLMVLATYRPAEVAVQEHVLGQAARALQREKRAVAIPLHELSRDDVRSYLDLRFPGADFTDSLAGVVHDYTDGVPLFVAAVVDHLVSRGSILETNPGWALTTAPRREDLEVPEEAHQLIQTLLESIAPADRAVLEVASVAGREFAVSVVASVLGAAGDDVETSCEALARARRFLRPAGSASGPSGGTTRRYAFAHEMYRQASYENMDHGRRQRLHQRVGEVLERDHGDRADEIAADLAHHYGRSGDFPRALRYLQAAAARARMRFASREAVGSLHAALDLVPRLVGDRERAARELELRLALSASLADLHGFGSADLLENALRAHALCDEVGSDEQQFQIVYGLCHMHTTRADSKAADATAAELEGLAQRLGTMGHRLLAETALLRMDVNGSRFSQACGRGERIAAERASGAGPAVSSFGADPVIAANGHYALAFWMVGEVSRADEIMRAAVAEAEDLRQPFTLTNALFFAALLATLRRDDAEASAYSERALAIARDQGFVQWMGAALALHGWARVRQGEPREGIAELEEARLALRDSTSMAFGGLVFTALADAFRRGGEVEAGLAAVYEGIAAGESSRDRMFLAELWRLEAELLLTGEDAGVTPRRPRPQEPEARKVAAEDCLLRAIELARSSEARSLELRAATSLARAWLAWGRGREARTLLQEACEGIAGDGENADLVEARSLLDATVPAGRRAAPRPRR